MEIEQKKPITILVPVKSKDRNPIAESQHGRVFTTEKLCINTDEGVREAEYIKEYDHDIKKLLFEGWKYSDGSEVDDSEIKEWYEPREGIFLTEQEYKELVERANGESNMEMEDDQDSNVCDIEGCDDTICSGGNAWREGGYWQVCTKHASDYRKGLPQPKMKETSIKREDSRGKDGFLPFSVKL